MSGYIICANDDYLGFMFGGKFRGFELSHVIVGKSNFFPLPLGLFGVS